MRDKLEFRIEEDVKLEGNEERKKKTKKKRTGKALTSCERRSESLMSKSRVKGLTSEESRFSGRLPLRQGCNGHFFQIKSFFYCLCFLSNN